MHLHACWLTEADDNEEDVRPMGHDVIALEMTSSVNRNTLTESGHRLKNVSGKCCYLLFYKSAEALTNFEI